MNSFLPKRSKYSPIADHLAKRQSDAVRLTFVEIERILGFSLPNSAKDHTAWWANTAHSTTHPWVTFWLRIGWRTEQVDLAAGAITFRSANGASTSKEGPQRKVQGQVKLGRIFRAEEADQTPEEGDSYTPTEVDERPLVERRIRERRGQQGFRDALRKRYGDLCLVTGCKLLDILEAAHIRAFRGKNDHNAENGLLLRADIHTLFDLNLLGINPNTLKVELHPEVEPEYRKLVGVRLRCPKRMRPSAITLSERYLVFCQRCTQPL